MTRGLMSLLSGLGQGYNEGTQRQLDNDRRAKLDQIALDRASREGTEFNQAQADRATLRASAAPVVETPDMVTDASGATMQRMVKPEEADNRDVGEAGTAPNMPSAMVAGQGGLNPMQAQAATAAQNTPEAADARYIAALRGIDPSKAMAMQAGMLTMKNAQIDSASKEFDAGINSAASKGIAALIDFTNKSGVSPNQSKAVPSADGKMVEIHLLGPDGTLKPTGLVYENSPKGAMEAATMLSRSVSPQLKLKHYMDEQEAARKEGHDKATEKYQDRMAGVAEQNAATNEAYRKDMGSAALTRADNVGKGAYDRMPQDVKAEYDGLKDQIKSDNASVTKHLLDPMYDAKNPSPGLAMVKAKLNSNQMRAAALLDKYRSDGDAPAVTDPAGLREPAPGAAQQPAVNRPQAKMEMILADMKRNGVTNAKADIDGQEFTIGKPAQDATKPPAAPASVSAPEPAGMALDQARERLVTATTKLMSFGSRQRMANPMGFQAAQAAVKAAKDARDQADAAYQLTIPKMSPSFAISRP